MGVRDLLLKTLTPLSRWEGWVTMKRKAIHQSWLRETQKESKEIRGMLLFRIFSASIPLLGFLLLDLVVAKTEGADRPRSWL